MNELWRTPCHLSSLMGMHPSRSSGALAAFTALVTLALAARPAAANLIANGNFETGPGVTSQGRVALAPGGSIASWTIAGGGVEYVSDQWWAPSSGTRSIGLNPETPGSIGQSFATAPGATYRVTFWQSGEPFTSPVVKQIRVRAAGQQADFAFDSQHAWDWDMGWLQRTWTFTANGASTLLEFVSLDAGDASPALDDVVVTLLTAGVDDEPPGLALLPVMPNPTRAGATVEFTLPSAGDVEIELYDMQGREVGYLVDAELPAGRHRVRWDPKRSPDAKPGLYFVRLNALGRSIVQRFAYIK